jgi:hypothetical protein
MVDRICQQIQRDLIDRAPGWGGEAIPFFFQFGWNLKTTALA